MKTKLILRAKHFLNANYSSPCGCPISKAGAEHFCSPVLEGIDVLVVVANMERHYHEEYLSSMFRADYIRAVAKNFNDDVIREIILTPEHDQPSPDYAIKLSVSSGEIMEHLTEAKLQLS